MEIKTLHPVIKLISPLSDGEIYANLTLRNLGGVVIVFVFLIATFSIIYGRRIISKAYFAERCVFFPS